jgi:hypothetical protein
MSAQHTPTPWGAEPKGGKGSWIKGASGEWAALSCGDEDATADANAEFICRAVNAHDDLVAALKYARDKADEYGSVINFAMIDAALAKAEGRS